MKKYIAVLLVFSLIIAMVSCGSRDDITCEDIIEAYEAEGYYVSHSEHRDDTPYVCTISARIDKNDPESDCIYFTLYSTEEEAIEAANENEYNVAIWMIALPFGEARWLKSKCYGKFAYTYYNSDTVKPFRELIK